MKPATKTLLESRIREMYRRAMAEDEQAAFEEGQAYGRRGHANECREVAAELQALLDGGQTLDVLRGVDAAQTDQDDAQRTIWRQEYNALPPADREAYGGFAGFVADKGGVDPYAREVQHVDEEPVGIPPHVWLYRNMLTEQQAVAPLGRDEANGQYAVAIDDLTDEQRAIPHVAGQLPDVLTVSVDAGLKIEENEIVRHSVDADGRALAHARRQMGDPK